MPQLESVEGTIAAMCKESSVQQKHTVQYHSTPCMIDARAAVRHDGVVFGGVLEVHEGGNSYTGELCAHIDAAEDAARGLADAEGTAVRAAYVFDAMSSVRRPGSSQSTIGPSKGFLPATSWTRRGWCVTELTWHFSCGRRHTWAPRLTSGRT